MGANRHGRRPAVRHAVLRSHLKGLANRMGGRRARRRRIVGVGVRAGGARMLGIDRVGRRTVEGAVGSAVAMAGRRRRRIVSCRPRWPGHCRVRGESVLGSQPGRAPNRFEPGPAATTSTDHPDKHQKPFSFSVSFFHFFIFSFFHFSILSFFHFSIFPFFHFFIFSFFHFSIFPFFHFSTFIFRSLSFFHPFIFSSLNFFMSSFFHPAIPSTSFRPGGVTRFGPAYTKIATNMRKPIIISETNTQRPQSFHLDV